MRTQCRLTWTPSKCWQPRLLSWTCSCGFRTDVSPRGVESSRSLCLDFGLANQIGTTDYSPLRRFRAMVEGIDTNDLPNLNAVAERLLDFQYYWATTAQPFEWKFTRQDLDELLIKLSTPR